MLEAGISLSRWLSFPIRNGAGELGNSGGAPHPLTFNKSRPGVVFKTPPVVLGAGCVGDNFSGVGHMCNAGNSNLV